MGPCPVNYEAAHQDLPESWTNVFAQLGQTGPPKIRQENTLTIFSLLFDNSNEGKGAKIKSGKNFLIQDIEIPIKEDIRQ